VPHHPRFPLVFLHSFRGGSQHHGRLFHLATVPREAVHLQVSHHRRQRHPFVPLGERTDRQYPPSVLRRQPRSPLPVRITHHQLRPHKHHLQPCFVCTSG